MGEPRRILFPYIGDSVGGSHISSLFLARHLPADRFVPVVGVHMHGLLDDYLGQIGVAPVELPTVDYPRMIPAWTQPLRIWSTGRRLASWLSDHEIDLVHSHDRRMHLSYAIACPKAEIPHIWHQRTPKQSAKMNEYSDRSAAILTVSDFTRDSLPERSRNRTKVVLNPFLAPADIDRSAARQRVLDAVGFQVDGPLVAYVANLDDRKDPMTFVAAAALMAKARPDVGFVMFGEARPPQADAVFAAIAKAGLAERCVHLGLRYPMEEWLTGCDVLLAPSRHEALSRTAIEALLFGLGLVASDEGGYPEIVADHPTGRLVPPADPAAFAAATLDLLGEWPPRSEIRQQVVDAVADRYGLQRHLDLVCAVYDQCLGQAQS
ncbi:glycosyltransferase family 4 protein [Actibacterium sp. 188UL27-1]|nr:glycosyltransferase family 4 protein [Actibacterium sp. 188UL27-1]